MYTKISIQGFGLPNSNHGPHRARYEWHQNFLFDVRDLQRYHDLKKAQRLLELSATRLLSIN